MESSRSSTQPKIPHIPLVDLGRQYRSICREVDPKISEVLASGNYILGENVKSFEIEFAKYCGSRSGVGVASGTDALSLCLKALGINTGDKVVTVPFTFIATVNAIIYNGARPVFVDIDKHTYTMDVSKLKHKITQKTKAIIPVHLYGHPVNMDPIIEIAERNNIHVIEDACQAHGAEYKGNKAGTFGDVGCFSFYPAKNLGGCGDGGMVLTDNEEIAQKLRMLRNYGERKKYHHEVVGYNSRLDELQAAILRIKLKYLDDWVEARRKIARKYNDLLARIDNISTPDEELYAKHSYHLYVIRTGHRDELRDWLRTKGISTGIHYPKPIHLQECFAQLGLSAGTFPNSEKVSKEVLSLPMFPELTDDEIHYISDSIGEFARNRT